MRLAIIVSHPIQYYSPWFRHIAEHMRQEVEGTRREARGQRPEDGDPDSLHAAELARRVAKRPTDTSNLQQNALRVFYLWDFGVTEKTDKGFGKVVKWDVDLLEGYDHELVPNVSVRPGTDWFGGLDNPGLSQRVKAFAPDAVLQFGYNYKSLVNFDLRWNTKRAPLLFRGDSHLLAEDGERGKGQEAMGTRLKRWMREIGLRLLFRRFACFLAVGKVNADYFRAHGVQESKIVRCPHVVDNAFFIAEKNAGTRHEATGDKGEGRGLREELGIPEDELVFLFAGKLEEKKQPLLLLEAFLRADLPKATLLFVGSGESEEALKEKAVKFSHGLKKIEEDSFSGGDPAGKSSSSGKTANCQLNTENSAHRVVFLEFQNQSRMPLVYPTGDVLVLPSKGRYETWGLAVNEAACCGLPAIVSSHVGCGPDLIEDGVTGWIFEAGNVLALKRALETAAANRDRLAAMGEALKQRVTREYSYQSATEALLAALNKL